MEYPTVAEVIAADQERISFWWHFLPDPKMSAQERVMDLIFKKFNVNGGFVAPELRKKIKRAENPAEVPNMRASKILRLALPVFFLLSFSSIVPAAPGDELPDMPKPKTEAIEQYKAQKASLATHKFYSKEAKITLGIEVPPGDSIWGSRATTWPNGGREVGLPVHSCAQVVGLTAVFTLPAKAWPIFYTANFTNWDDFRVGI
jgi:hypothetical protein